MYSARSLQPKATGIKQKWFVLKMWDIYMVCAIERTSSQNNNTEYLSWLPEHEEKICVKPGEISPVQFIDW